MAVPDELSTFVKDALAQGHEREELRRVLREAGWRPEQVERALGRYAEVGFALPVPRPKPYLSAREAFLYLLLFICLYLSAFQLGSLIFQLIDSAIPDPARATYLDVSEDRLRWAMATLVVAFPLFLYLSHYLGKALRGDPTKRASKVRLWLTYLTLMVASGFLIGDLIHLVDGLLGGDLTLRFFLKVLTIGMIAGAVFLYYFFTIRGDEKEEP